MDGADTTNATMIYGLLRSRDALIVGTVTMGGISCSGRGEEGGERGDGGEAGGNICGGGDGWCGET